MNDWHNYLIQGHEFNKYGHLHATTHTLSSISY